MIDRLEQIERADDLAAGLRWSHPGLADLMRLCARVLRGW